MNKTIFLINIDLLATLMKHHEINGEKIETLIRPVIENISKV